VTTKSEITNTSALILRTPYSPAHYSHDGASDQPKRASCCLQPHCRVVGQPVLRAGTIEAERAALEKRSQAEDARWEKQKEKLEIALRRARG
jgi:hypothetical protein